MKALLARIPNPAFSLKSRVALVMTALFVAAIGFVTAVQLQEVRRSMYDTLAAQQNTLVTRVADEIDEKFRLRQQALSGVAEHLGAAALESMVQAQVELSAQASLPTMFDHVFIFSPRGEVLANAPFGQQFVRFNVAQRAYFSETVAQRKPVISAPYRSLVDNAPYVMMTAPIFDSNGQLVGVLGGAISLLKSNFLGGIGMTPVGQKGYFYVISTGERPIIINHPDRARILAPAGSDRSRASALALGGFEGTTESVSSRGMQALSSFKRLKETSWVLGAVLPADEAFGPIGEAQQRVLLLAGLVAAMLGAMIWAAAYWLLLPVQALHEYVRARRAGAQSMPDMPVRRRDEIGVLAEDINGLMLSEHAIKQALADNEARLRTITDHLPVLISYIDREQRYRFNNQPYQEWFGVPAQEFEGKTMLEMLGAERHEQLRPEVEQALAGYIVNRERELVLGGRKRFIRSTYMPDYGPQAQVLGFYAMVHDITAQKAAESRLAFLAHHDSLTELPNRASFSDRVSLAISRAQRSLKPFAVMYLDIDKFKGINDTLGHGMGDHLLKAFARRLKENVRGTDVVGRLGGDEFVILAEDLAAATDAEGIAAKIVTAMREPFHLGAQDVRATASVGVAICARDFLSLTVSGLLECADGALYQAKQGGRDGYRIELAEEGAAAAMPSPLIGEPSGEKVSVPA
jgi:diguanylate cyclase (GGDEF)-like protein/PAS domain S-box-containing protein